MASAPKAALWRAVVNVGSQVGLARICGTKQQNIHWWLTTDCPVPPDICVRIEIGGGDVRVEELRPDLNWQRDGRGRLKGYFVPLAA